MENTTFWIISDTQTGVNKIHNTTTVEKTAFYVFPDMQTGHHELYRPSRLVKPSRAVKPGFWIFPDTQIGVNKLHYTSTVVKTDFNVHLTLKQVSRSFIKLVFKVPPDTKTYVQEPQGTSIMEKNAFWILSVIQTCLYKLHTTPTVVNTASRSTRTHKQVCTSFTELQQR